ncbi:sulfite exporter TauE/SafE family protein [Marinimicrobium sp. ARAG 43.8]|uniref:sulfite exporter TauE/SafE family protein n=1 Tax=Marinimicrobium sp. ARAG 43.8 TaxID=3418719 RepID=UPI003CEFA20D
MTEVLPGLPGAWLAAFTLGLFSGAHCIGMCGGIVGALSVAIPADQRGARRWGLHLGYNVGRITSYSVMGVLAGLVAGGVAPLTPVLRVLAGLLLVAMGLYLAGWWRGLLLLERAGGRLWRHIQPLGRRLMPVARLPQAVLLGALWGWLPCGLVYTALAYALMQGDALVSGGVMLAFGLGTLPSLLAAGLMAGKLTQLLQQRALRTVLAVLIMVFGAWTLWPVVVSGHHHEPSEDGEMAPMQHHH